MLLKIYTTQNTIKVISDIEDVEIHNSKWRVDDIAQIKDTLNFGPGVFTETGYSPSEVEIYEFTRFIGDIRSQSGTEICDISNVEIKLVDYKKSGQWHRVAVCQYAYLCNDDGKTISKID